MPTYEYVCTKCDHQFEKTQRMSDQPLTVCPKELCGMKRWGKGRVKKLIGAGAGLIFKGSGFYITDYRSENYKAGAKKEAAPSATAAGGDSKTAKTETKSSETKPAAPKAAKSKAGAD